MLIATLIVSLLINAVCITFYFIFHVIGKDAVDNIDSFNKHHYLDNYYSKYTDRDK